jgi:fatty-acyl-CoA synthase
VSLFDRVADEARRRLVRPLEDVVTLARSGVLRPLTPRTTLEVTRRFLREGVKMHLIYTLHATQTPSKPAIVFEDTTRTWSQLTDRIRRLANHFIAWGVRPGNTVAIMLPNRPEFVEANAAAMRIGATVAYLNPRMPAADARALLQRTGARVLITHRDDVNANARVLFVPTYYEGAIAAAPSGEPDVERGAEGKVVVFTSGTTGRPKGAVRSLDQMSSPSLFVGFLRTIPLRTSDVHMVVCPMYHSSGSGFATAAQLMGNTCVIVEKFSPEAFCRTVEEHKVTSTAVVPTMLHQLASWPDAKTFDLSSLRVVVCTGAALREEVREAARDLFGEVVYDLYGSTEMAWVSVATPADQLRKPGSVGKPVPGVDIRIVDADGREVGPGRAGEIWAGSSLGMQSYLDDPELQAERMRGGYVSVRDVGYLDDEGYLYVVDRADDMIISGGVNVYPAETEVVLESHPNVKEAAVVGVPDPKWGEKIVASVVADGGVGTEDLLAWCREKLAYAAVPKEIRITDELPRNDVGKVDKRRVADEWPPRSEAEGDG